MHSLSNTGSLNNSCYYNNRTEKWFEVENDSLKEKEKNGCFRNPKHNGWNLNGEFLTSVSNRDK